MTFFLWLAALTRLRQFSDTVAREHTVHNPLPRPSAQRTIHRESANPGSASDSSLLAGSESISIRLPFYSNRCSSSAAQFGRGQSRRRARAESTPRNTSIAHIAAAEPANNSNELLANLNRLHSEQRSELFQFTGDM